MEMKRKSDPGPYTKYRPHRFFKDGGKWYFHTREGTEEGPIEYREEAEERMLDYIRIVNSGFYVESSGLSLEAIESRC
jgi:hypothetical protein